MRGPNPHRRRERGLTLVEMLVAVAILAIAVVAALTLYDRSRKSFKQGENVAEQQQAVRVGFDRLASDLRMAGYNTNPDGDANRPDEQIEGAFDGAMVIRADFDAHDPTLSLTPETALATGGSQITVSTGNDEIVIYALGKPGWTGGQTLQFQADVKDSPRNNTLETISIPNLALTQSATEAPYTLYRITLNNDLGTWGSPNFIVRTPLVENIRSLTFSYFDGSRTPIPAATMGGMDTTTAKIARGNVRRINVAMVGLTRDKDLEWRDQNDPNPSTQAYRKFELASDVAPRNLGFKGIRDLTTDNTPPSPPGTPTLVPGHCGGLYVTWPANPSGEGVSGYKIAYGTSPGSTLATRTSSTNSIYLAGLSTGTTYYVRIVAYDSSNNESGPSTEVNAAVTNTTIPTKPANLVASDDAVGLVSLSWDATTTNTSAVSGDPISPQIRDLAGYRVYRSTSNSFASATQIADEATLGTMPFPTMTDATVANCVDYHYWVKAVDTCGTLSDREPASTGEHGEAVAATPPAAPTDPNAAPLGGSQARVTWTAVTNDTATPQANPIYIDRYKIERTGLCGLLDTACQTNFTQAYYATGGATTYVDNSAAGIDARNTYWYRVRAVDCAESEASPAVAAMCAFQGRATFITPQPGPISGVVPIKVQVLEAAQPDSGITYEPATITITNTSTGQAVATIGPITPTTETIGGLLIPTYEAQWLADPPGYSYRISIAVPDSAGCSQGASVQIDALARVGCCLDTNPAQGQPPKVMLSCSGSGTKGTDCTTMTYQVYNQRCLTSVRIDQMTVSWIDSLGNNAKLQSVAMDTNTFWTPGAASPATSPSFSLLVPPISIPYSKTIQSNTMRYEFSDGMRKNQSANEPVNTTFYFTLLGFDGTPTQVTGQCGPTGDFSIVIP